MLTVNPKGFNNGLISPAEVPHGEALSLITQANASASAVFCARVFCKYAYPKSMVKPAKPMINIIENAAMIEIEPLFF